MIKNKRSPSVCFFLLRLLWKNDKLYIIAYLLISVFSTARTLLAVYMPKYIVDGLAGDAVVGPVADHDLRSFEE